MKFKKLNLFRISTLIITVYLINYQNAMPSSNKSGKKHTSNRNKSSPSIEKTTLQKKDKGTSATSKIRGSSSSKPVFKELAPNVESKKSSNVLKDQKNKKDKKEEISIKINQGESSKTYNIPLKESKNKGKEKMDKESPVPEKGNSNPKVEIEEVSKRRIEVPIQILPRSSSRARTDEKEKAKDKGKDKGKEKKKDQGEPSTSRRRDATPSTSAFTAPSTSVSIPHIHITPLTPGLSLFPSVPRIPTSIQGFPQIQIGSSRPSANIPSRHHHAPHCNHQHHHHHPLFDFDDEDDDEDDDDEAEFADMMRFLSTQLVRPGGHVHNADCPHSRNHGGSNTTPLHTVVVDLGSFFDQSQMLFEILHPHRNWEGASPEFVKKHETLRRKLKLPMDIQSVSFNDRFHLIIRRKRVFRDTYNTIKATLANERKTLLHKPLSVEFFDEKAVDAGGITREFFMQISIDMFNPARKLFRYASTKTYKMEFHPKAFALEKKASQYLKFAGQIMALSIINDNHLSVLFVPTIFKILLKKEVVPNDLEGVDEEVYKNLKMVENCKDPSELSLYFTATNEADGTEHELVPGGKDILVTKKNVDRYVRKYAHWKLMGQFEKHIRQFLKGFNSVIPQKYLIDTEFTVEELELLICGVHKISFDDWERNTDYVGYTKHDKTIKYFWEIVKKMNQKERRALLQFVTGSDRLPVNGFAGLMGSLGAKRFTIEKLPYNRRDTVIRFPDTSTCENTIRLPDYRDATLLKKKLLEAVNGSRGFYDAHAPDNMRERTL